MFAAIEHHWVLLLLPLASVPFLRFLNRRLATGAVALLAPDRVTGYIVNVVKTLAAAAIVALLLGLAGLHQPAHSITRVGTGAHVILLIDRSRSMDQPFASERNAMVGIDVRKFDSKGRIARRVLSDFVDSRQSDMFAMVAFSTFPIPVLPLTAKQAIVQAAINSGDFGRGLSQTNMAAGLQRALHYYDNKAYTGSRIVVLVSDGAAHIDGATRYRLAKMLEASRAALYWIYIRSRNGPKILGEEEAMSPERSLHRFFANTGAPYRAYTAESPADLKRAIDDVNQLQNLPMHYEDKVARVAYDKLCYLFAAIALLPLLLLRGLELARW